MASAKIVEPGGEIIAETGVVEGIATAELDVTAAVAAARRSMGHLRERRPAAYVSAEVEMLASVRE